MKIAVVDLGYVGLPLCLQFRRSGGEALALDLDRARVEARNLAALVAPEKVWRA